MRKITCSTTYFDINDRPQKSSQALSEPTLLEYGDSHGNTLRFLHALVSAGACEFAQSQYDRLLAIYNEALLSDLSVESFQAFSAILQSIQITPGYDQHVFHFLGDLFADRGASDALTFEAMRIFRQKGLKIETISGNHEQMFWFKLYEYLLEDRGMLTDDFPSFLRKLSRKHDSFFRSGTHFFNFLKTAPHDIKENLLDECCHYLSTTHFVHARFAKDDIEDKTLGTTLEVTAHTPFNFFAFDKLFNKLQLPRHSLITDIRALNDALRKYLQRFEHHIQALRGTEFIDIETPEIKELAELLFEDRSLENFLNSRKFEVDKTIVRLNKDLFNDSPTISRVNILHGHTGNNGAEIEDEDGVLSFDFIEYFSHKEESHLLMREIFFNDYSMAVINCDITAGQPYFNEASQIAGHIEGHIPCRQRSLNTFYKLEDEYHLRNTATEIDRTIESSPEYLLSTDDSEESRASEMIEDASDSDDESASEECKVNSYDTRFFSARNDAANLSCCFLSCVPPL